ncbi:hypothetical protein GGR54DRAFT_642768 [Hypoxylon sp. NC1633]|nr:hypothetical protein GGR54DRAFT_642768 [Hypoxylon sp. NC1633]
MASKRGAGNDAEVPPSKRRDQKSSRSISTIDQNYGQRTVFGSSECMTTVPTGDIDLECEDDTEALAYLGSVRLQASTIPHVMVASKAGPQTPPRTRSESADGLDEQLEGTDKEHIDRSIYKDGRGDFRGYYQDGAYTAYPDGYFESDEDEEGEDYENESYNHEQGEQEEGDMDLDYNDESSPESGDGRPHNSSSDEIREAYFTSLTNQYLALRKLLQSNPPHHLLNTLPKSNPASVNGSGRRSETFAKWSGRLRGTDPLPSQIAGMHKDDVFHLLHIILHGKFLRKTTNLRERTSRWIWALLARLPERGELDYQEISWIRELGKRAVLMMVSLTEMEILKEHYDVGSSNGDASFPGGEVEVEEGIDEELSYDNHDFDDDIGTEIQDLDADSGELNGDPHVNNCESTSCLTKEDNATASTTNSRTQPTLHVNGYAKFTSSTGSTEAETAIQADTPAAAEDFKEASDVEMQIDSDEEKEEKEEGEVFDTPQHAEDPAADIDAAKAQLLAQLYGTPIADATVTDAGQAADQDSILDTYSDAGVVTADDPSLTATERAAFLALEAEEKAKEQELLHRARVNERATLNMILTVAGEFYGQRDLLEFRDPFGGLQVLGE